MKAIKQRIVRMTDLSVVVLTIIFMACSIRPHSNVEDLEYNKAVIDLNKTEVEKAEPANPKKRSKIARPKEERVDASTEKEKVAPVQEAKKEEKKEKQTEEPYRLPPYRLGYGDKVEVKFFNNDEYNELLTVRPDGKITLQLIGDVDVMGKTPTEITQIITDVYAEILLKPEVTVFVREFGGQLCYVMGEVNLPGAIEISKGMTLMRAVAAAGGPKNTAKLSSVILIRSDDLKRAEVSRRNLSLGNLSKHTEQDLSIQAYDIIYVPKTFIADISAFVTQIYEIVLPPFDAWARYEFWYRRVD